MKKDTILHAIGNRLVRHGRTPVRLGTHSSALRDALRTMLLLFTLGTTTAWGQTKTDYSGLYYFVNCGSEKNTNGPEDLGIADITDDTNYFYLVPADNPHQSPSKRDAWYSDGDTNGDSEKPYLTTYRTNKDAAAIPEGVTNRPYNSVWIVKYASTDSETETDYYYLIHAATGKYVVYEPPFLDTKNNRKSVHLLTTNTPGENAKFAITTNSDNYNFRPKSVENGSGVNKYLNPSNRNFNCYYSNTAVSDGDVVNYEGLLGLWKEAGKASDWKPEETLLGRPTVSVNVESGTFSIIPFVTPVFPSGYELPSDYTIRYTTGDGTQDAPTPTTSGQYTGYPYSEAVRIRNFKNVKAVIVGHDMVLSEVADVDVKCDIPSLTSYDATNHRVVFETSTTGATIYYTSTTDGSDPEDPTTSTNSGYGSSPLTINDVNGTTKFKAIAVKEGMVPSDVFSQILVVDQTITLSSSSFAYTGLAIEPTVSINNGDIPDTEYEVSYSNNINAGTATATITNQSGGNYYVIGGSVDFVITTVPLTITANPHTITYGDAPDNNGVTYTGFVNNESQSVLGGQIGYTYSYTQYGDVGDYTITPSGQTSDNYAITFNPGTLTVTPKEVGLSWETDLTYKGIEQTPTATATGTVNGDEIGVTVTGGQTNIGSGYTATASALTGDKAGNYKLPEANTTAFTIAKAPLTVTAKNHTISYGDAPAGNGVTYSGFVNSETESVLSGTPKFYYNYSQYEDVGNYVITPYDLTATNYAITFVPGTLTVNPKEVGITWGETTLAYNGSAQTPTATATGTVNGDEIGVTVTGGQTDAGETVHTATASALTGDKAGNYKLPESATAKTTDFTIDQAPLTVIANDHTIIYGTIPANNGVTYTGFVTGDDESKLTGTLAYAYDYSQYGDVGSYSITPSGLSSTNYDITFKTGTLTVTPKEVRITWGETALTYNGAAQVPTATITSAEEDVVNNDVVSGVTATPSANTGSSLTGVSAINPGYYRATASFTGDDAANYKPVPEIQPFSISSKIIGDGNEAAEGITITFDTEKVENGDVNGIVSSVTDGETTLSTDDYTVEIITQGFDNYIKVSGVGNYGGSVQKLLVKPEFYLYTEPEETADYAAVYRASSDLSKPAGLTPYIVSKVNPSIGTISITEVKYLPKDVPVLMLSATNIKGFLASSKPAESVDHISGITAETENSNLLKVAPEGGVTVEDAQVYMFYQGEFVLTKEGTISEGKFYLNNPNYTATSNPAGSRSVLRFVVGDDTGIIDIEMSEDSRTASGNDAWYSLDGRRLSGRPTKQGLYIWNGRKTVINKK